MINLEQEKVSAISWQDNKLILLDQRLLPTKVEYISFDNVNAIANAITDMVVRGAPAIGITAAYGVVIAVRSRLVGSKKGWTASVEKGVLQDIELLAASRPTAVNLFWALARMKTLIESFSTANSAASSDATSTSTHTHKINDSRNTVSKDWVSILLDTAIKIHDEDVSANHLMGRLGAELITENCSVLTHCNAGSLATGGFGTALGVIRQAYKTGKIQHVYADETRPWLQGARLTAWELTQEQIPVSLLVEGAAAHLLKQGKVKWVIVGADRIAANGDVANKIGTYGLAVLARYHQVKFMVVAPTSTFDMNLASGDEIEIENRSQSEILSFSGDRIAPEGVEAWNPAFDITPASLIDVIVSEKGVIQQPSSEKLSSLMQER